MTVDRMNAETAQDDARFLALAKECAELYRPLGRFAHGYTRGKLLHDPVSRQMLELGPFRGPLCDLGCGRGQLTLLLACAQRDLELVGFDWDESKVALANSAAERLGATGVRFERGDLRTLQAPCSATILMLDVLHYNSLEVQDQMLARAANALMPGGRLLLREVDQNGSWRARMNVIQERLGCALMLNRGTTLCFRSGASIESVLRGHGLKTRRFESCRGTPLANVLIEATR